MYIFWRSSAGRASKGDGGEDDMVECELVWSMVWSDGCGAVDNVIEFQWEEFPLCLFLAVVCFGRVVCVTMWFVVVSVVVPIGNADGGEHSDLGLGGKREMPERNQETEKDDCR